MLTSCECWSVRGPHIYILRAFTGIGSIQELFNATGIVLPRIGFV